ncbi:hypothetical protein [Streptomyces globosus]|uniref:hypothetical protein n=1 Tax=Streptomyces globosus TaxID=68209 RepID=UPI0038019752
MAFTKAVTAPRRAMAAATAGSCLMLALTACDDKAVAIPGTICGTPISPTLAEPLLRPRGKIVEASLVEQPRPGLMPCDVLVDGKPALTIRFGFHDGLPADLLVRSRESTIVGLTDPVRVDLGFEDSVLGNEGAAATAPCKTAGGDHFTFKMKVDRANPLKRDLRPHVEAFTRAYMAETLKTLGCG